MPFVLVLFISYLLVFDWCFPCSHSFEGSFNEATHEAIGESKPTSPRSQMVATSGGSAPNPSPQEARVIVSQKTTPGPSESPSKHVSCFSLAIGGAPEPYFRMTC